MIPRWLAALALSLLLAAVGGGSASAQAVGVDDDGLRLAVDTAYRLDVEGRDVDVTLAVTATNVLEDEAGEFGVTRFYFDEVTFLVPLEAIGVEVADTSEGRLDVSVTPRDVGGVAEVVVAMAPRLYSQETRSFEIRFSLPADAPRSEGDIRINPAFAWFYVWSYGDPGQASVSVSLDPSFDVEVLGDRLVDTVDVDGNRLLRAGDIEDPAAWVAVVSARNDAALEQTVVPVSDAQVTLEWWPGDEEWATGVGRVLVEGVPVLEELTGFEWGTDLTVVQGFGPLIHGYGGWYVDGADRIEIGEDLDAHLILHEVSHAWFDADLFGQRWITEGLADAYAARAVQRLGAEPWDRDDVLASGLGNVPLNDWDGPTLDGRTLDRTEDFGYSAAWQVTESLIDRVGEAVMAEVLAAAADDTIAYVGEGPPEPVAPADDWRRYLDLVEERGAVDVSDLFAEWVVADGDRGLLEARAEARSSYRQLERVSGEWGLPLGLRQVMGEWDFDRAADMIDGLAEVVAARDTLGVAASAIGAAPPSLESAFESGEDADVLSAQLAAQRLAVDSVASAITASEAPRSALQRLGLAGAGLEGELDAARSSIGSGDLADAAARAGFVIDTVERAQRDGLIRLAGAIILILAAALIMAVAGRRRRRGRSSQPPEMEVSRI